MSPSLSKRSSRAISFATDDLVEFVQLALMAHDSILGPLIVVHRVKGEDQLHAFSCRMKIHEGVAIVRLSVGHEVDQGCIRNSSVEHYLPVGVSNFRSEWHACPFHELHLLRARSGHSIDECSARA